MRRWELRRAGKSPWLTWLGDTRQDDTIPIKVHHCAAAAGVDRNIAEILRCHFEVELVRAGEEVADQRLVIRAVEYEYISDGGGRNLRRSVGYIYDVR
jgi:hypothetical protein